MTRNEEQEAYKLKAGLNGFKRKEDKALGILSDVIQQANRPALSFSGGKDSVVLLDMAVRAGFKGELVFFRYGKPETHETPEENIDLLKYYSSLCNLDYTVLDCLGETDCWELCERFTLFPQDEREKKIFRITNNDFREKVKVHEEERGTDLQIIGMRKQESRNRRIMLTVKGPVYSTKQRQALTCCPLVDFSDEDIWAYIFSRGLKYLSIYDYPFIDRRKNRNEVTLLYNDAVVRHGGMFHFKRMYPEYFGYIRQRWGDVV